MGIPDRSYVAKTLNAIIQGNNSLGINSLGHYQPGR